VIGALGAERRHLLLEVADALPRRLLLIAKCHAPRLSAPFAVTMVGIMSRSSWLVLPAVLAQGCDAAVGLDDLEARPPRTPGFELVWAKRFGGPGAQQASFVTVDQTGTIYVAGTFKGSIDLGGEPLSEPRFPNGFVAALDPSGAHLWSRRIAAGQDIRVRDLASTPAGDLAVVGMYIGALELDATRLPDSDWWDGFVFRLRADGTVAAAGAVSGSEYQIAHRVAFDEDGVAWVGGSFDTELRVLTADGAVLHTATEAGEPAGFHDLWLARFDHGWDDPWRAASGMTLGDEDDQELGALAVDRDGNVIVAGTAAGALDIDGTRLAARGGSDVFMASLDRDLRHRWSHMIGSEETNCHDKCEVVLDAGGDDLQFSAAITGGADFGDGPWFAEAPAELFAARFDAEGRASAAHGWNRMWQNQYSERPYGLAVDAGGNVVIVGQYFGDVDFGGGALGDGDGNALDYFLLGYDRDGGYRFSLGIPNASKKGNEEQNGVYPPDVALTPEGHIVICGAFRGSVDILGEHFESTDGDDNYDSFVAVLAWRP
jgi:hypothetical protein